MANKPLSPYIPRILRQSQKSATHKLAIFLGIACLFATVSASAAVIEFNNTGGTNATNGLHFYIEDTTRIQVRRLNNTGQVYSPTVIPPNTELDNGIFLRANGKIYGPSHTVGNNFNPSGGMYNTFTISAAAPANPTISGVQQTATSKFGITAGPQASVVWKYTTPLDFITAEVTFTIPAGYAVSAANPVRYYHVVDTYLGGSDNGCGVKYTDASSNLVVGTYPPVTGTTCGSNSALPAGVTIVESFRERDGLSFGNYCVAKYDTFFTGTTGTPNCSIAQAAVMSNTIVNTFQDTGIGIEFNFTSAGTYTFSYDFVIGSYQVPPYDHIEIQHDGTTTLCPDTVKVLACTSSTVPCPAANIVNTGTLTGTLTAAASSGPALTIATNPFTLGISASNATLSLQGSAAGSYTLGTSGLSSVPLNGTKCWNTATNAEGCGFTVVNTPCVSGFECMETSVTPYNNLTATPAARNPLYTKITDTPFTFDVVALQSGGAQATAYTATQNVIVELFDDTIAPQPACSAYAVANRVAPSQAITFAAGNNGRKTITTNINLAKAYRKLRCRVTDANFATPLYGCSSDRFAVRPQSFTSITSTNATADSTGLSTTATPKIKAGASFTLAAATTTLGYDDIPKINASRTEWLATTDSPAGGRPTNGRAAPGVGTVSGSFSAAIATPTGTPTSSTATGAAFTYDDVGYFRFQPQGVYDDSFTSYSNDVANGDCINTGTNDATNVLVGNKYGCKFGNTAATNHFGRFIPDHFGVAGSLVTRSDLQVTEGQPPATAFTYMDEPMKLRDLQVTAYNSNDTITLNYADDALASKSFSKLSATSLGTGSNWFNIGCADGVACMGIGAKNATKGLSDRLEIVSSGIYSSVAAPSIAWDDGIGTVNVHFKLKRLAAPDGPYDSLAIGVAPHDLDGVVLPAASSTDTHKVDLDASAALLASNPDGSNERRLIGTTRSRFGTVRMISGQGSNLSPYLMQLEARYWNGIYWLTHVDDSLTPLAIGNGMVKSWVGTGSAPAFTASSSPFRSGIANMRLSAPGSAGLATVCLDLDNATTVRDTTCLATIPMNAPYLQGMWGSGVTTYDRDPFAQIQFGAPRPNSRANWGYIYRRENY